MENTETYTVVGFKEGQEVIVAEKLHFEEAMLLIQQNENQYENISIAEERVVEDKPKNFLIVSDVQQMLPELKLLLNRPAAFQERFVFLGNFISDGQGFYDTMSYLCLLKEKKDCVFVKGKNEHNLLAYLNETEDYIGPIPDVVRLIESIEADLSFPVYSLEEKFPEFYDLLSNAYDFYENDQYIFTSGGLNLSLEGWRQSKANELFQTSEEFLIGINQTNKRIVFGNVPVQVLHQSQVATPWFNNKRNKIGINGDCRGGGKLLALVIHDNIPTFIGIRNIQSRKKTISVY